jgi:hypothetical protein
VQGEDPATFDTLLESLTAEYQPETQMQQIIVGEAASKFAYETEPFPSSLIRNATTCVFGPPGPIPPPKSFAASNFLMVCPLNMLG